MQGHGYPGIPDATGQESQEGMVGTFNSFMPPIGLPDADPWMEDRRALP